MATTFQNLAENPTGSPSVPKKMNYFSRPSSTIRRCSHGSETDLGPSKPAAKTYLGPSKPAAKTTVLRDTEKLSLVQRIASRSIDEDISFLSPLDPSLQLELTSAAILLNPGNSFAWEARREVLDGVPDYWSTELDTIMDLMPEFNHTNVWFHRLCIAKVLGFDAVLKEFKHTIDHLSESPKDSYGAWHNLKILSLEVGPELLGDEFNLLKKIINEDNENHHAWDHLGETMTLKLNVTTARRELKEMITLLKVEPKHKHAWRYLLRLASRFSRECMVDAIKLIDDIIEDDRLNSLAWAYRWGVCAWEVLGMSKEFEFTRKVLLKDSTNRHAWDYRQKLLEKVAKMGKGGDADVYCLEDELTKLILSKRENANNARVWYQRRWLLETFGEWDAELTYSTGFVENDVDNECAWQHRSFILLSCDDLGDVERTSEVTRVTVAIRTNPKNRFLWMYLQSLYIPTPSHDTNLGSVFESVCFEAHDQIKNIIIITNALETLSCVISLGYKPSKKLGDFMTTWFSSNTLSVDNMNLGKLKRCEYYNCPRSERKICFDDFMHREDFTWRPEQQPGLVQEKVVSHHMESR